MKILHLVLYSDNEDYNAMYDITCVYYKKFNYIKTIYYRFANIENDFELNNDILLIKGTETYNPGILDKTIKTIKYFNDEYPNYDYVVRSNISTIVNFNLLTKYLIDNPIEYGGGYLNIIYWVDKLSGVDESLFNTIYASGTCIVFNTNIFKYILDNINNFRLDVIDDVSIGLLLKDINKIGIGSFYHVIDLNDNYDIIKKNINNTIFYRNRNPSRKLDVKQMKAIVDILIDNF